MQKKVFLHLLIMVTVFLRSLNGIRQLDVRQIKVTKKNSPLCRQNRQSARLSREGSSFSVDTFKIRLHQ